MSGLPWKPWHEVVALRDDLKSGELSMHLFAADLYEVVMQTGQRPVYEDPTQFFSLTFPTHNLRLLARDVALRLAGKNDRAVHQLTLTYGGGKTHTLITLRHLVADPGKLPDLPAVQEFIETMGIKPPKSCVAALCFDKFDIESGVEIRAPDGTPRKLRHPWSHLAYQIAGDDGLKAIHPKSKAEERDTPPGEITLVELLQRPGKKKQGMLILLDEVLMFARGKIRQDPGWLDILMNFFQALTQAAAKVDRCCLVTSLLSSNPRDEDQLGTKIVSSIYDIFGRQREAAVQPVEKEDVAEVLRRRLFAPESICDRGLFRPHVIAALKGIQSLDEQTAKNGPAAEERFFQSYPFHPDLTEVMYAKWTSIQGFQRTRGVLRTFALALREAAQWDKSPLVGPAVFLGAPGKDGLSESARELVTVADTIVSEGPSTKWTGILESELFQALQVQEDSIGLRQREIEQAVMAVFLHSQPIGHSAQTRDLMLLVGPCRPDRIEFEKGLLRWGRTSFWLDDSNFEEGEGKLPKEWRLGNRPNLNQMHAAAQEQISAEVVKARLGEEIAKNKTLTAGASGLGVRVHTLPAHPRDIEDDGAFHYAVLGPSAASESGKPSAEAKRFLDQTTNENKPRVFRNAVLLLTPSREGIEVAEKRIREFMAWERVREDLVPKNEDEKKQKPAVDLARFQTLQIALEKAKTRIPDAVSQAYSTVVAVSEGNEVQAFKVGFSGEPHFMAIKADARARIQDSAITAETLLPGGPYNLWVEGETCRQVKDLAGAFAQLPHLPKMLKARAIVDTLVTGCEDGHFVLRLMRPDRTFRTWWRSRPDEQATGDPALELVLPEAASLSDIPCDLLSPKALPTLWEGEEITLSKACDYFNSDTPISVERDGYTEQILIPKAPADVVMKAAEAAVHAGRLWLLNGPASVCGEPVPGGVLTPTARLRAPPPPVSAVEVLPENLPAAWKSGTASLSALHAAISVQKAVNLPWKMVEDAVRSAMAGHFIERQTADGSWTGVCDAVLDSQTTLRPVTGAQPKPPVPPLPPCVLAAQADVDSSQFQDLADAIPGILKVQADSGVPVKFTVRIEVGDGQTKPSDDVIRKMNDLLKDLPYGFKLS